MRCEPDAVTMSEQLVAEGHKGLDIAAAPDDVHNNVQPNVRGRLPGVLVDGRLVFVLVPVAGLPFSGVKVVGNEPAEGSEQPGIGIELDAVIICFTRLVSMIRDSGDEEG
jgi:hypothetical protein